MTAEIRITDIPEDLAPFKEGGFSKYVSVFGVHIFATPDARDEKLLHAAKVMAEYLALIAKSSKHENAKQPHWAQARSSCWGTRSPPL